MRRYIDAASILSEARMMWESYRDAYVLVEGETDRTFYSALLGAIPHIQFRALNGWENVSNTINLAMKASFSHVLGIIDRDYHAIANDGIEEHTQLAFTDSNDIEMMLITSSAYDKFLKVCGSNAKVDSYQDIRAPVLTAAFPLGILRALSLLNGYNLYFDGIACKDFITKDDLLTNIDTLIEKVFQRTRSSGTKVTVSNEDAKRQIIDMQTLGNPLDFCNGHDVLDILSLAMTKAFASASANEYSPESIFNYLLMGYHRTEFEKSALYGKFDTWLKGHVYNT